MYKVEEWNQSKEKVIFVYATNKKNIWEHAALLANNYWYLVDDFKAFFFFFLLSHCSPPHLVFLFLSLRLC